MDPNEDQVNLMNQIYFNASKGGFSSFKYFYAALQKRVPYSIAKDWFSKNTVSQVFKPLKRSPNPTRHFIAYNSGVYMLSDAMVLESNFSVYKFVYLGSDLFSKKLSFLPVSKLGSAQLIRAVNHFTKDLEFKAPFTIVSDRGADYTSLAFQQYTADNHIKHIFSTGVSLSKIAPIERAIRSIRGIVAKIRFSDKSIPLIKAIGNAVHILNSNPRLKSGLSPDEIDRSTESKQISALQTSKEKEIEKIYMKTNKLPNIARFHVGQRVRRRVNKKQFEKESKRPNYSVEIYTVIKILPSTPYNSYMLSDSHGSVFGSYPESYLISADGA